MTPIQKVARARQLLIEATRTLQRRARATVAAQPCRCGHRRDAHTVSCSVNYTEGCCMTPRCPCRWFLYADGGPVETRPF